MKIQTTLFFLLFSSFLMAQDVLLFEDSKSETLVFSSASTSDNSLRQILQTLQPRHGHHASFDLYYAYQCRLIEKPNLLFSELNFTDLHLSHAPSLRGFSFTHLLSPSSATLTIDLLAGDEVVHSVCESVSLSNLDQAAIHFNYSDIQPSTVYTLVVKDLKFNYSNTRVQVVRKRKNAIDNYYLAGGDLRQMLSNIIALGEVNPDPDHIYAVNDEVNEWVAQFNKIDKAPFWNILQLQNNHFDPDGLLELHKEVGNELNNVQAWLKNLMTSIHELFYEKGVALFEDKQIGAAKTAFQKSIDAAGNYAPSHYFLAQIDFIDGRIDLAGKRITKVLNEYNPDPGTRQNSEALARDIIRGYLNEGQRFVDAGQFPEGVDLYRHAQSFGQNIRGFHYGQEEAKSRIREAYYLDFHRQIDEVIALRRQGNNEQALVILEQALAFQVDFQVNSSIDVYGLHQGIVLEIYNSKLDQIKTLAHNHNWDEGIYSLNDAQKFINIYPEFIQNKHQFLELKTIVYTGKHDDLYQSAANSKATGQLDKALDDATKAQRFATDNGLAVVLIDQSDLQIKEIQQARYQRFVQGGDRARQQQQFAKALQQYEAAKALGQELNYLPNPAALAKKMKGTALQEIKRLYDEVMHLYPKDNQQLASVFSTIQNLSGQYHLTLEPEVKTIYIQLQDQQCINANEILLPELESELSQHQKNMDYPQANKTLEDIKSLLFSYPDCQLSDRVVLEHSASIIACASYQETLAAAISFEKSHRFRTALDHYLQAKEMYQNPMVVSRLNGHKAFNTYDYTINHPDNNMVIAGANLYLDQRDHEAALALLKSLIARGIPSKRTENLQERLGSALAVRHYTKLVNWKKSFALFVAKHERRSYKDLQRAFRKQWNKMG